ncbi:hypothetical protein D3C78_1322420 [compost metagenome]
MKGRQREKKDRRAADGEKRPAADPVAQQADRRLDEQHADHDSDDDENAVILAVIQRF